MCIVVFPCEDRTLSTSVVSMHKCESGWPLCLWLASSWDFAELMYWFLGEFSVCLIVCPCVFSTKNNGYLEEEVCMRFLCNLYYL